MNLTSKPLSVIFERLLRQLNYLVRIMLHKYMVSTLHINKLSNIICVLFIFLSCYQSCDHGKQYK